MTNVRSPLMHTVYVVDASVAVTGAFVCARNQARVLARHARVVLVLPRTSTIPASELRDFDEVRHASLGEIRKSFRALLSYCPQVIVSSWQICKWMRLDGATRLQFNDFYFTQVLFCRLFGFRGRILTWVRTDPRRFGARLARAWMRIVGACSDEVLVVSRFIQAIVDASCQSHLIYDCVVEAQPATPDPAPGKRRLVYIANYIPGKGQDDALECFAHLAKEFPDVVLEFWGGDMGLQKNMDYREALVKRSEALGLTGSVRFEGFAPDPRSVLAGAYVALNFSHSESFSMTALEGSAAGLPVIATACGGPSEIVQDGVTGVLVPVHDRDSITCALRGLLANPAKARRMGDEARAFARSTFNASDFRRKLLDALRLRPATGQDLAEMSVDVDPAGYHKGVKS